MIKKITIIILLAICFLPLGVKAVSMGQLYAGRFIINKDLDKSLWYVNRDKLRYPILSAQDMFVYSRMSAETVNLKMMLLSSSTTSTAKFLAEHKGAVIKSEDFEYWFIGNDQKLYSLSKPEAWANLQAQALPLVYKDFIRIYKPGKKEAINSYSSWERQTVKTDQNNLTFSLDVITIDLNNPKLKVITDAAADGDCPKKCPAKSVASYALEHKAFAAINGSYFDTSAAKKNYYFFPVYDTVKKVMVNESQLKYWTTGPVMAFDSQNNFYYFKGSRDFKKAVDFKAIGGPIIKQDNKSGVLTSAIGNLPVLVKEGHDFLLDFAMDQKQKTHKALLSALCYKAEAGGKGKIMLVSARNASLADLARILLKMKVDYGLNLDGGGSAAVIYGDELMIGPGRDVPNAILFAEK